MQTMKAFVSPSHGSQRVVLAEVPIPDISDDELLVRVHAIGVGIHDSYFLPTDAIFPYPVGIEGAGVIEAVGAKVAGHLVGDRIAFVSSMQAKGGTWAEFVAVKNGSLIVPIPHGMDFVSAAAVPVAGNTVLRALRALPPIRAGGSLFVAGGSGAIGTLAIPLAVRRGWRVGASASAANRGYLLSLGADLAVDYRDPTWPEQVLAWRPGGVDAALAIQPGTSSASLPVVKDGGSLISISGDELTRERGIQTMGVPYGLDVQQELVEVMADIVRGTLRVELERVFPFAQALDALAKVRTRHARGMIVLAME
ncbi:NADPH2:quinone reductase [Arthrobacter sp. UYCu511]